MKPLSTFLSIAINESQRHQEKNSRELRESNLGLLGEKRACYLSIWKFGRVVINSQAAREKTLSSWVNKSRGVATRRNDFCRIVVYPWPQGTPAPHKTEWLRFEHQLAGKKSSNCFAAKFWKLSKQKSPTVKIFSIKFSIFLRLTSTSLWHARIAVVLLLLAFYFKSTFQEFLPSLSFLSLFRPSQHSYASIFIAFTTNR